MTTATQTTTETTATAGFTVAAEMIAVEHIHAAANVRSGKLPNIPSLAESIRREGVLTAVTVDRRDDGDFDLVAGFRRVAASRLAGLTSIPAVIRDRTGEAERLRRCLAENIEREGLRDLDQAAAMQQLLDLGVEAEAVAETVHTTPDNVRAWADLLKLPRKVRGLIEKGRMTASDAYPLVSLLDDREAMTSALKRVDDGWDVERAVRDTTRERERERVVAATREKLDAEGCRVIDAPQYSYFPATSKTQKLGKGHGEVQVAVRAHATMSCHAAFISHHGDTVHVCLDRNQHAGAEGSGVPNLKAERAAKRTAKKALRQAHAIRFQALCDAVRSHAFGHDEAIAYLLRLSIDDAQPSDHATAASLLDVTVPEGHRMHGEREALLTHAATGPDALLDVALAVAIARGERALTSERFDWRRTMVAEHANLIRSTGIHKFTTAEMAVIAQRGPSRWEYDAQVDGEGTEVRPDEDE